jgi:hypothetical protein
MHTYNGSNTSSSTFGNTRTGFDKGGTRGATKARANGDTEGISDEGTGRMFKVTG